MSDYIIRPYRGGDRQRRWRKVHPIDLERTQFRAGGWSLRRSGRAALRWGDYVLALAIMGLIPLGLAAALSVPVYCAWKVLAWALGG